MGTSTLMRSAQRDPGWCKGCAEQQAKYLPELQAEWSFLLVGRAACERYKRRSVLLL